MTRGCHFNREPVSATRNRVMSTVKAQNWVEVNSRRASKQVKVNGQDVKWGCGHHECPCATFSYSQGGKVKKLAVKILDPSPVYVYLISLNNGLA